MAAQNTISARHALIPRELSFCKIFAGFGFTNHTEAYRRAYYPEKKDSTGFEAEHPNLPDPKEVTRQAKSLLQRPHIQAFLLELRAPAGDRAREVLAEQAHFGGERAAATAATRILEDEDRLGFRDAVEQWANIMCAVGTDVVVPLPGGGEVSFPLREMFPRFNDPMPPIDVLEKTEKALAAYRKKLMETDDNG